MINSKNHMEQTNPEMGVLTDAELDSINGGNRFVDAVRAVGHLRPCMVPATFARRPTNSDIIFQTEPHGRSAVS